MAYTPTEWNCGDTITAEKLNKLENGLAECCGGSNAPLIVDLISVEEATLAECPYGGRKVTYSHSWQEVYDAVMSGKTVYGRDYGPNGGVALYPIVSIGQSGESWIWRFDTTETEFTSPTSKVSIDCNVL